MNRRQQDENSTSKEPAGPKARSRAVEDYLKAIHHLQSEGGSVSTSALAEELERSPASVTNMVKSLAERGLVEHQPYYGVRLSAAGEREALRIIRRHRIIEAYLIERLGYSWDRVHAEAERLEHAASDELVDRMAAALGHPSLDPHGSPIPTREGVLEEREFPALADLKGGSSAVVREVSDSDDERLRYLAELDLYPGTLVRVVEHEPFEGSIRIRVGARERSISPSLAEAVKVEPVEAKRGAHRGDVDDQSGG